MGLPTSIVSDQPGKRGTGAVRKKEDIHRNAKALTSVAGFARGYYDRPGAQAQLAAMRVAFAATTAEAFIAGTETIERTDLSPLLPKVRAPTLLLAGQEDNMTPFSPSASGVGFSRIQTLLPDCRMVVLPECGHYLVLEQPEKAAAEIASFLNAPD